MLNTDISHLSGCSRRHLGPRHPPHVLSTTLSLTVRVCFYLKVTSSPTPDNATSHLRRATKTIGPQVMHISVPQSSVFHQNRHKLLISPHLYQTLGLNSTWQRMSIGESDHLQLSDPPSSKQHTLRQSSLAHFRLELSIQGLSRSARQVLTKARYHIVHNSPSRAFSVCEGSR